MDESTRQRFETQSNELRAKIKKWEVEFKESHNGTRPGRIDIKSAGLHSVYKEYQRLRDTLDGKIPPPLQPCTGANDKEKHTAQHRKRKSPQQPLESQNDRHNHSHSQTPSSKRLKMAATPSSRTRRDNFLMSQFTPGGMTLATPSLNRTLFSPAVIPTSIGPTPQRDGRVLGLFDALPFKDAEIDSPCKPAQRADAAHSTKQAIGQTPRKVSSRKDAQLMEKLGRTPSSHHKNHSPRNQTRTLVTPLKLLDDSARASKTPGTSSSTTSKQFQTPAFLRRIPMPKITENSELASPERIRLPPRKPLLRGLSSVVADLRKIQEDQLDDDLDALREMENETAVVVGNDDTNDGPPPSPSKIRVKPPKTQPKQEDVATLLAEDEEKQALMLLGGFDDEGKYDSAGEEGAGMDRNGQPLRVFKKKGQKRTTRRSNMRPVRTMRPTTNDDEADGRDDEDPTSLSGSDFDASDDEDELAMDMGNTTGSKTKAKKRPPTKKDVGADKGTKKQTEPKKPARKVNELAHANFKRLKLRNNGAKGGPGYNSRFRRRR